MKRFGEADDPRRRLLIQALAAGAFSTQLPNAFAAGIFGSKPEKLPPDQSVYRISGQATVNDQEATLETRIRPGDTVKTAADSEIVFVVNTHSMIVRESSTLVLEADAAPSAATGLLLRGLRMLTGKLLSVSRNSQVQVRTATSTIGIRGTGFYVEAEPEQTYFCLCYGLAEVAANSDPESKETVAAERHDKPLYIVGDAAAGRNIRGAPFINHTDEELALIETLVGRTAPFVFPTGTYQAPRREY